MLPSSAQVQTVYGSGVIPALRSLPADLAKKTLCIDSTTLDVAVARQVAQDVIETGACMVDAPVSGGVTGAKAGTLSFLVGGADASFQAVHPVLSMMGERIVHCGPAGAGLGAKICNNVNISVHIYIHPIISLILFIRTAQLILGVQQIVVAEAMILGQKLGLDPVILSSVIGSSTGNCWSVSVNNPVQSALPDKSPPCERDYEGGFATALMAKVGVREILGFAS